MSQPPDDPATTPSPAGTGREARLAREAAALRQNLHRRKRQSRARADATGPDRSVEEGRGSAPDPFEAGP